MIGRDWEKRFDPQLLRGTDTLLSAPLCLVGSLRYAPANPDIPKFARSLQAAHDYLNCEPGYDFFFGATAIPQLTQLGLAFSRIERFAGEVSERIADLLRPPPTDPDKTIYEFLVAAAFERRNRPVEFVRTAQHKPPDLRIGPQSESVFVECKRKAELSEYEASEARTLLELFRAVRAETVERGICGVVDLSFRDPIDEIAAAAVLTGLDGALRTKGRIYRSWGSVEFTRSEWETTVPPTRLYSPIFLERVFGWSCDIPSHDGMICQVTPPESFHVERVTGGLAFKWNSLSPTAIAKKSRAVLSLFGKAIQQFPDRSIGIPYLAYSETARAEVANRRTVALKNEFLHLEHQRGIVVPEMRVSRLYAAPIGHGDPDLIENTLKMRADYAPANLPDVLPSSIFTDPLPERN